MELQELIDSIKPVDKKFFTIAQNRLDMLTKPQGSLGRLEEFCKTLVGITENPMPDISRKVIFVFAGDHGIVEEGVSAFPKEVTRQMVKNFLARGAAINCLASHVGAEVVVVDTSVAYDFGSHPGLISKKIVSGTKNMTKTAAMTYQQAMQSLAVGIDVASEFSKAGYNFFAAGEMGIGNTTPSSAIVSALTGKPVAEVTGRGTGIDTQSYQKKIKVIEKAIALNQPDPNDPVDVLAKVGGAEIGAIAGLVLGAALNRIPVVIDGFISSVGALIAHRLCPNVQHYLFAAHRSVEAGHTVILEAMGLTPILDLNMRLGEGTGAALAMIIIEGALKTYKEMATFGSAEVSEAVD